MHPLQQKIRHITRRAQHVRWRYAVACFVAVACSVALVVAGADFAFRFRDAGLRFIGSLVVWSAVVLAWWRFIRPVWSFDQTDVSTAQHIERVFPRLSGQLSSAISFLEQEASDPRAGSLSLRRAVVASAQGTMEQLDWKTCLRMQRSRRAIGIAVGVLLVMAIAVALQPHTALLAARRLAFPWEDNPWPRRHELTVEAPLRVAAGDDFEIVVRDAKGTLPGRVEIVYRVQGEASPPQAQAMDILRDTAVHRLVNVSKSFEYRVIGGDDDTMPWQAVEVVLRPSVSEVQINVTPPTYSGLPNTTEQRDFRALAGSTAAAVGKVQDGTRTIQLQYKTGKKVVSIPGNLKGDRFALSPSVPWLIDQTGTYWFELRDDRGLLGGDERKWEARAIPDLPPIVSIQKAPNDGFTTPAAAIPLRMLVKDDLAIRTVELRFQVSRPAGADNEASRTEGTVRLYASPTTPDKLAPARATSLADGDNRTIEHRWELDKLTNLSSGDTLEFTIVAEDFKSQRGKSATRKWVVISPPDFENRIAQRQSRIIAALAEVLRQQQQARSQTSDVQIQWQESNEYGKRDLDRLQSSELAQRQIAQRLSDQRDGIPDSIRQMLKDLRNNGVDSPDVYRRLNKLLTAINRLSSNQLPAIQSSLTLTLKQAREQLPGLDGETRGKPSKSMAKSIEASVAGQDAVIRVLENLLGDLSQWDSYRRFAREIAQVARDQAGVSSKTEQLMLSTLTTQPDQLRPGQRAAIRQLAQRQRDLARRFERIQARMEDMQAKLADSDPLAAATIGDAVQTARRMAVSGQMRESGRHIEKTRFSRGRDAQADVKRGLDEILDILANRRELELGRIARQLRDAANRLGGLQGRQQQLDLQLKAANAKSGAAKKRALENAAKASQQLADDIKKLTRQLKRLEAQQAAEAAAEAGGQSAAAAKAAKQGQASNAEQKNQQAGKALQKAQEAVQRKRRQIEQDLLQEQFARMEQSIQGLRQRQANIAKTTVEIESLRKVQGRLKRSQALTVQGLASQQEELANEATALAEQLAGAAAFQLSLKGVSAEMFRASSGLNRAETGQAVQAPQENAIQRLDQLLEALKQQNQTPKPNQGSPGQGGQKPQQGNNNQLLQLLAQLRLARLMQQRVHERTVALEQLKAKQGLTEEQKEEYRQLAEEQGKLADIFYNLIQVQKNPEENPDQLPKPEKTDNGNDDLNQQLDRQLDKQIPGFK